MQGQRTTTDDIDVTPDEGNDYDDLELPEIIARQAQALAGADEPPRTLGEQSELFAQTQAFQAQSEGDIEEMLIADDSRHAIHLADETIYTYCFLDALGIAVLLNGPVEVTTQPPGMDVTIELTVSGEGIRGATPDMVVAYGFSTGLSTDVAELAELSSEETLAAMHEHGCPTQNLFPDDEAYEVWADQADAATMPMSLPQAFAMVRDYVEDWELPPDAVEDTIDIRPSDGDGYAERELRDEITETLRVLTGLVGVEREPETLGDFAQLHGDMAAFSPDELGIEATLLAEHSRHEVHLDDRTAHTNCILDALILGVREEDPVQVTTHPPGSEDVIEFTVSERGIHGAREDMVVSFGFSNQLPSDPAAFEERTHDEVLAIAHEHGCPKINLFPSEDAYEAWASQADAITMPMSLPQALALARDTVRSWDRTGPVDTEPREDDDIAAPDLPEEIMGLYERVDPDEFELDDLLIDQGDTRHEVQIGDRSVNTYCILDALILGVREEDPVEVTTRPPGSNEVIEFTVSERGIHGAREDMVVSFGFSDQISSDPAAFEDKPQEELLEIAHEHGCPTINLFPDEEAYQAWASQADAVTVSMSLQEALALARDIVDSGEE